MNTFILCILAALNCAFINIQYFRSMHKDQTPDAFAKLSVKTILYGWLSIISLFLFVGFLVKL